MRNSLVYPNRLAREIDNIFSGWLSNPDVRNDEQRDFYPRVDIRDSKDETVLVFELPGLDRKDIKVSVKENVLRVSGERQAVTADENVRYIRSEIETGKFSRSFTLPDTVDTQKISADYRNGLLEVKLARKEEVKPKEIEVSVA